MKEKDNEDVIEVVWEEKLWLKQANRELKQSERELVQVSHIIEKWGKWVRGKNGLYRYYPYPKKSDRLVIP